MSIATITYLDNSDHIVSRNYSTLWEDEFVVCLLKNVLIIRRARKDEEMRKLMKTQMPTFQMTY